MAQGWRTFDHTADLGLEVEADSPAGLFALAAVALLAQVAECPADQRPAEVAREVSIEAADPADLLVEWLNRALLAAELDRAIWTSAQIHSLGPRSLEATLRGPRRDRATMTFLREIKAVSHHALELSLEPGRCRCAVVLDL